MFVWSFRIAYELTKKQGEDIRPGKIYVWEKHLRRTCKKYNKRKAKHANQKKEKEKPNKKEERHTKRTGKKVGFQSSENAKRKNN
jgi:hypothetical protein